MNFLTLSGILEKIKHQNMNSILKKVLTYLILPAIIAGLTYLIVQSIMEPVEFNKQKAFRED